MLTLNLLPDVKKEYLKAQRQRNLVVFASIIATGVAVGILLILGGIMGGQQISKSLMESSIKKSEDTIKKAQKDDQLNKYMTVQNQLSQISQLKQDEPTLSRVFTYLLQINPAAPNNVTISTMKINTTGSESGEDDTIVIEGKIGSYASLDVFKTTLQKAKIKYSKKEFGTELPSSDDTNSTISGNSSNTSSTNTNDTTGDSNTDGSDNSDVVTENLFSNVVISNETLTEDESGGTVVSFTATITYNKAAFARDSDNIQIEVPKETTSDADRNAPTTVFDGETESDKAKNGDTGGSNE